jgi:hypothetical protein
MPVHISLCALRPCHDSSRSVYVVSRRLFLLLAIFFLLRRLLLYFPSPIWMRRCSPLQLVFLPHCPATILVNSFCCFVVTLFPSSDLLQIFGLLFSPDDSDVVVIVFFTGFSMPAHAAAARRRPRSPSASPPSPRRRRRRSVDAPVLPTPSLSPARRPRPLATSPPPQRRRGLADVSSVSIPALPRRPHGRGRVLFSGDASDSEFSMPSRFPGLLEGSPHGVPADCRLPHPPSVLAVVSQPSLPVEEVPSVAIQSHFPTCSLVLPRSRRRRGLDEIPGNSAPLPLRTLSSMPVPSGLTVRTNSALPAVSNQSVSMLTPSDLEARRREIRLGKRLADDVPSVPTESVPYADSSDDELSSYCSALAAGFFPDGESSNATTHVNVPSNPSDLNAWAPFPSAHSSALGSLAQPGPSLSQIVGSDDDSPNMGTLGLRYLARGKKLVPS